MLINNKLKSSGWETGKIWLSEQSFMIKKKTEIQECLIYFFNNNSNNIIYEYLTPI